MTARRPPGTIKVAKPAIRQVRPQIRDMHDPNAPTVPIPPAARSGQIYMPAGPAEPVIPHRNQTQPRAAPGAPVSRTNAELRSKIARLERELSDLRTASRELVLKVMARSKDAQCKLAAEEVMAILRGKGDPPLNSTQEEDDT